MKRLSGVIAAVLLANTLMFVGPAKAYYPTPGEIFFEQGLVGWLVLVTLDYSSTPPQDAPALGAGVSPTKDCATGAPVRIERKKKTGWVKVLKGKTNKKAKFKKKLDPAKPGKYRAHIPAYTTPDGNSCFEGYGKPKKFTK
ncbi:MAG: hypothetical protein GEU71_16050 [Actinobacteria bacterium]|nr:hypothetical protein [Actinomycetota bacterium]